MTTGRLASALTIGAVAALAFAVAPGGPTYEVAWHSIDAGGGTSTGGGFAISGTIGQPDAGATMTGGGFAVTGGFWPAVIVDGPVPCVGDCGAVDGVVDVLDLLALLGAWGGQGACDSNGDEVIDVLDLLDLLGAWGMCP